MPSSAAPLHPAEQATRPARPSPAEGPVTSSESPASSPAAPRSGRSRLGQILLLGCLSMFAPLSIDMYLPALPTLSRDLDATASEAQLTLSAFFLGLALGQAVIGPLSDALGRRRPLLVGVAAYAVASLLCAFAPNIIGLVGFRFVQGFAGAAGIVISRAIVRDLHSGIAAARFMSVLMLVSGLAPILAPILGGQLLRFAPWQGLFLLLAVAGGVLLVVISTRLPETLPADKRQTGGFGATVATFGQLLTNRAFMGYALANGLAIGGVFAYISGSPFILQDLFGVSPQAFSLIFGVNALGMVVSGQVNGRLVGRVQPARLLAIALTTAACASLTLLAVVAFGQLGLVGILPPLFIILSSLGFIMPNATVLALSGAPKIAGSASALLGLMQFALGSVVAPLVGLGGTATALPMALTLATLDLAALTTFLLLARNPARSQESGDRSQESLAMSGE
jgi:MFS transporter, DHA1 family, multidrug resistance protein